MYMYSPVYIYCEGGKNLNSEKGKRLGVIWNFRFSENL
jgi:hypothetical protein